MAERAVLCEACACRLRNGYVCACTQPCARVAHPHTCHTHACHTHTRVRHTHTYTRAAGSLPLWSGSGRAWRRRALATAASRVCLPHAGTHTRAGPTHAVRGPCTSTAAQLRDPRPLLAFRPASKQASTRTHIQPCPCAGDMTQKRRNEAIDSFQRDPRVSVFMLTVRSGGLLGSNLRRCWGGARVLLLRLE
jgi:hypothetical protein